MLFGCKFQPCGIPVFLEDKIKNNSTTDFSCLVSWFVSKPSFHSAEEMWIPHGMEKMEQRGFNLCIRILNIMLCLV